MTRAAFAHHIAAAFAAKQLGGQQIFILRLMLCRCLFIRCHALLHTVKQFFSHNCRNAAGLHNILLLEFTDVFTVVQHSGNDVYGDFIASIGANAFQIQFVGDFLHGRAVRITCECVNQGFLATTYYSNLLFHYI